MSDSPPNTPSDSEEAPKPKLSFGVPASTPDTTKTQPTGQPARPTPVQPSQPTAPPAAAQAQESPAPQNSGLGYAPPKKAVSNTARIIICAVLVVLIGITGAIYLDKVQSNKDNKRIQEMLDLAVDGKSQTISVDRRDLGLLLDVITSLSENDERPTYRRILIIAEATDSADIDALILERALSERVNEGIRADLLSLVLMERANHEIFDDLLAFAQEAQNEKLSLAAIKAVSRSAVAEDAADLLKIVTKHPHSLSRKAAETILSDLIKQTTQEVFIAREILPLFNDQLDSSAKFALIRLLGHTGYDKAKPPILTALQSNDMLHLVSGLTAISYWPTDEFYQPLIARIPLLKETVLREKAFEAASNLLIAENDRTEEESLTMWNLLKQAAQKPKEKHAIINNIAKTDHKWIEDFLVPYLEDNDDGVAEHAERSINKLIKD